MLFIKKISFLFLLLTMSVPLKAQNIFKESKIDSSFINYVKKPREVAYSHLNKSTFIIGEDIGFTTYILNSTTNLLSSFTSNLYCVIKDENEKVVKKQLIKVENGVAHNSILIDSLFTSGTYKFFAFTNC